MSDPNNNDFFIGWEGEPAPAAVKKSRGSSLVFVFFAVAAAAAMALLQGNFLPETSWDFTQIEYEGVLIAEPIPILIGKKKGSDDKENVHYLVLETKHAPTPEDLAQFHLKPVTISGSRIADENEAVGLIALLGLDQIKIAPGEASNPMPDGESREVVLGGEIIDSKCAFGAMNPALFKPHRACAIRCISGGVPPVLRTKHEDGAMTYYLLVGDKGQAINSEILDYVALPVRIRGHLQTLGDWKVICAEEISLIPNGS